MTQLARARHLDIMGFPPYRIVITNTELKLMETQVTMWFSQVKPVKKQATRVFMSFHEVWLVISVMIGDWLGN